MQDGLEIKTDNIITSTEISDVHKEFFKKSHELVFSQLSLTPIQHDIFALFLSAYHKENWDEFLEKGEISKIPQYEFHADILCDWFGLSKGHLATVLASPCENLSGKKIGFKGEDEFDFIPLFSRVRYKNGKLTISPNHQLTKAYIGVSRGHSLIPHREFRLLKLETSKRLYSILCRFKDKGMTLHPQTLQELHGLFGLVDENGNLKKKTYGVTANFISRIIKPAIQEINAIDNNISFVIDEKSGNTGFSYDKSGRKIIGLKFLFEWKQTERSKMNKVEFTYEDAINVYKDLMSGIECLPSEGELENTMIYIGIMAIDKELDFAVDMAGFMQRYSEAKSALSTMGS